MRKEIEKVIMVRRVGDWRRGAEVPYYLVEGEDGSMNFFPEKWWPEPPQPGEIVVIVGEPHKHPRGMEWSKWAELAWRPAEDQ